MDTGFIIRSMENKTLLITGSTGFLGKVFMEEVLRVQPQVKKLYLLLRAPDNTSATKRFQQVIRKDVFRVLREQHGEGFDNFISGKVVAFAGDVSLKNLGIKDFKLEQKMLKEIDLIIHAAATTKLDERYDVALSINTLGPKHVCEFSKKCQKLELLLHLSTSYVGRGTEGVIFETPMKMGDILNENSKALNIELELKIAQERLKQLCELEEAPDKIVTMSMKELGTQRARFHGWTTSYQLTKAMGEMLLGELREKSVPLVIIRPSIVTSTWKQPFPGWIEGFKHIDTLLHIYSKGELTHFLTDPYSIMDVIPVDMVVNAMIMAMAAHRRSYILLYNHLPPPPPQEDGIFIYHVSSSSRTPIKYSHLFNWAYGYFSKNPRLDGNGIPIKVPRLNLFPCMASFSKYITLHYKLPLEALLAVKDSSLNKSSTFEDLYSKLDRKYRFLNRLLELFGPVLLFRAIFDNSNMVKLGATLVKEEASEGDDDDVKFCFAFDTENIDWEDYFKNVHFPGITKYVFIRSISRSSRLVSESKL